MNRNRLTEINFINLVDKVKRIGSKKTSAYHEWLDQVILLQERHQKLAGQMVLMEERLEILEHKAKVIEIINNRALTE